MLLDLAALAFIGMLAALGWRGGGLRSLARWGALIAAWALSVPLARVVEPQIAIWLGEYARFSGMVAPLLSWLGLYLLFRLITSTVVNFLHLSELVFNADRFFGVALGVLKGALLCYVMACLASVAEAPLSQASAGLGAQLQSSELLSFARQNNLLTALWQSQPELPAGLQLPRLQGPL